MSADPGGITVDQRSDISSATNPPGQDIIGKVSLRSYPERLRGEGADTALL